MSENEIDVKTKRQRSKNFTDYEKETLTELILPHKSIIENLKTDGITNQKKNVAWSHITDVYNIHQTSGLRTILQLKNLYDFQKRLTRKKTSDYKTESKMAVVIHKTEGDNSVSSFYPSQKVNGSDKIDSSLNDFDCGTEYSTNPDTLQDELTTIELKKSKTEYETSKIEQKLMIQKLKFEVEKMESEARQNKMKEELLSLELQYKKKMFGLT